MPPTKITVTPLQASYKRVDAAYDEFLSSLLETMDHIAKTMVENKIERLGLGTGAPLAQQGVGRGVHLTRMEVRDGKIALFDKSGERYRIDQVEAECLHTLVSRIRGTAVMQKLGL